jgi:DNA-binding MarR family transcriptional regulator
VLTQHKRPEAKLVADAVEGLVATLVRQRRAASDPEPGELSTFQAIALATLVDRGSMRLGSLAETLGTTDATASRTVDVLEGQGLAQRRPDPADARGVIVDASAEGKADVRRRRRRLERLAARALGDLSHDEARRVASALAELRTLLDRD